VQDGFIVTVERY